LRFFLFENEAFTKFLFSDQFLGICFVEMGLKTVGRVSFAAARVLAKVKLGLRGALGFSRSTTSASARAHHWFTDGSISV